MLEADDLARVYRSLYLARRVEEVIARIYPSDKIKSPVHLSIGQEAVSVGVCDVLRQDDVVFATYRGHAAYLAKGGDLKAFMAELFGKATGCARGKGGSMHLVDVAHGVLGMSAVVATTIPHAVGYAWALQHLGTDRVVACFFGDGATEEGVFHESLNFASLKRLPVLFVCENNGYAIHARVLERRPHDRIHELVSAYGISNEFVRQNDVLQLRDKTQAAVAMLRGGQGPCYIEVETYRWKEHVGPGDDWHLGYRDPLEAKPWKEGDQVARIAALLEPAVRGRIESTVEAEIEAAVRFAEESPFPAPEELRSDEVAA